MQEGTTEVGRGEETADKWNSTSKRGVGCEGCSDELQMLTVSVGMSNHGETWPRAESWHATRPGRVGEL